MQEPFIRDALKTALDLENRVCSFFEANKASLTKDATNSEAYVFAMEMEKTGIEMYR